MVGVVVRILIYYSGQLQEGFGISDMNFEASVLVGRYRLSEESFRDSWLYLLEEPGELPPVIPLDSGRGPVVEAVHANVFIVVTAEYLGDEKTVGKVPAT